MIVIYRNAKGDITTAQLGQPIKGAVLGFREHGTFFGAADGDVREALVAGTIIDIAAIRERLGISRAQLAERLGVTRQAVGKWETGAASPTEKHLEKIRLM